MSLFRLKEDIKALSYSFSVVVDDDYSSIIVKNFNLPPGYNRGQIPVLLELPSDYPESPPGVGSAMVYVPDDLRFNGRKPNDFHDGNGADGWAWWCYEWIAWNPKRDNLITFFELLRAHMTNPD